MVESSDTAISRRLHTLEIRINQGLEKAREGSRLAGEALREIRDNRLYKEKHHTFEQYLSRRWNGISRQRAYQLIDHADTVDSLRTALSSTPPANQMSTTVDKNCSKGEEVKSWSMPSAETQTRPLKKLPTPEAKAEVWKDAVEVSGGEQPTAETVERLTKQALEGMSNEQRLRAIQKEQERIQARKAVSKKSESQRRYDKLLGSLKQALKLATGFGGDGENACQMIEQAIAVVQAEIIP